ncbi:hypothetical protein HF086_014900 [Spodoptera exigua]|uniref:Uncharacterized protein n=1 Tax=Spodoptera exigua TaxID=7107 RepID=A0A922MJP0_SPOEX|nr:hypothetical protein HF086_014900 [Spodoptera exigua]
MSTLELLRTISVPLQAGTRYQEDPASRLDFCRFMLNANVENPDFLRHILRTDEFKIDKVGITNYHKAHYWAPKE